jgi:hypothetical protein
VSKLVCVGVADGDMVMATPGVIPYPPATSGSWSSGPIIYKNASKLFVNGNNVTFQAECTFLFNGIQTPPPPGTPVSGSSNVTLSPPSSTKLKESGKSLLRIGDTKSDSYGNTLTVVGGSNTKLKSA